MRRDATQGELGRFGTPLPHPHRPPPKAFIVRAPVPLLTSVGVYGIGRRMSARRPTEPQETTGTAARIGLNAWLPAKPQSLRNERSHRPA